MTVNPAGVVGIRVKTARDIQATGDPGALDRYLIDSADSGGVIAVVEHLLAPLTLAAPIHRHSREDEYSLVLAGRLGVFEEGDEIVALPGELVFKPRGRWHTFWNAGDEPASCLELISPAGLEQLFRTFAELTEPPTPDQMTEMAAGYHCDIDMEATIPVLERHGLTF